MVRPASATQPLRNQTPPKRETGALASPGLFPQPFNLFSIPSRCIMADVATKPKKRTFQQTAGTYIAPDGKIHKFVKGQAGDIVRTHVDLTKHCVNQFVELKALPPPPPPEEDDDEAPEPQKPVVEKPKEKESPWDIAKRIGFKIKEVKTGGYNVVQNGNRLNQNGPLKDLDALQKFCEDIG